MPLIPRSLHIAGRFFFKMLPVPLLLKCGMHDEIHNKSVMNTISDNATEAYKAATDL